jgi:hypothetical protein
MIHLRYLNKTKHYRISFMENININQFVVYNCLLYLTSSLTIIRKKLNLIETRTCSQIHLRASQCLKHILKYTLRLDKIISICEWIVIVLNADAIINITIFEFNLKYLRNILFTHCHHKNNGTNSLILLY